MATAKQTCPAHPSSRRWNLRRASLNFRTTSIWYMYIRSKFHFHIASYPNSSPINPADATITSVIISTKIVALTAMTRVFSEVLMRFRSKNKAFGRRTIPAKISWMISERIHWRARLADEKNLPGDPARQRRGLNLDSGYPVPRVSGIADRFGGRHENRGQDWSGTSRQWGTLEDWAYRRGDVTRRGSKEPHLGDRVTSFLSRLAWYQQDGDSANGAAHLGLRMRGRREKETPDRSLRIILISPSSFLEEEGNFDGFRQDCPGKLWRSLNRFIIFLVEISSRAERSRNVELPLWKFPPHQGLSSSGHHLYALARNSSPWRGRRIYVH